MALIGQLGEFCTGIAEVVGSNPVQSLNFFQVFVSVVFRLHSHLMSLVIRRLQVFLTHYLVEELAVVSRLNKIKVIGYIRIMSVSLLHMFDVTVRAVHV